MTVAPTIAVISAAWHGIPASINAAARQNQRARMGICRSFLDKDSALPWRGGFTISSESRCTCAARCRSSTSEESPAGPSYHREARTRDARAILLDAQAFQDPATGRGE